MATKQILKNKEKVIAGIIKAADLVGSTMGPNGNTVALANSRGELRFTKDGVSVAKEISLEDPIENIGAQLVINSSEKTVEECGDGTTATAVLLKQFVEKDPGSVDLKPIFEELERQSKEVKTMDEVFGIAKTSANSEEIGLFIKDIYEDVGLKADVAVEQSDLAHTEYEVITGMKFHSGYLSSVFATSENGDCVFKNAVIAIDGSKRSDFNFYKTAMEEASKLQKPLVFISPDFSSEVKRLMIQNVKQNNFPVCLVKAPGHGEQINENFKDIRALQSADGSVEKIVIKANSFFIYNDKPAGLEARLKEIKTILSSGFTEDYSHQRHVNRLAELRGTAAIIYAGGITEKNMKEEYDRIEDAVEAVKSALRGGYVSGGGTALKSIESLLPSILGCTYDKLHKDNNLKADKARYDKELIIDPKDVVISALKNSYASYSLFKDTEYIVYNETKNQLFGG